MFHSQRHVVVVQLHPGPLHRLAPEDSIPHGLEKRQGSF